MSATKPFPVGDEVTAAFLNTLAGVIDRETSEIDVVSTTTETTIFSHTIPAGAMGTDRMLRLTLLGDILENTGGTGTLRVKLGGVELFERGIGFVADADRIPYELVIEIANLGANAVQWLSGRMFQGDAAAATPGPGQGGGNGTIRQFSATGTVDTSAAAALEITVQWSGASANASWRRKYAVLELVG